MGCVVDVASVELAQKAFPAGEVLAAGRRNPEPREEQLGSARSGDPERVEVPPAVSPHPKPAIEATERRY